TVQNDRAEAAAIAGALGDAACRVPVFSLKGATGHTLGAAGALELVAALEAPRGGVAPASAGHGEPEAGLRVLDRAEPSAARTALKLSAAFGGVNAALVVSLDPPPSVAPRAARWPAVTRAVSVSAEDAEPSALAARAGYAAD